MTESRPPSLSLGRPWATGARCLLLGLGWYALILIRPSISTLHCAQSAEACLPSQLLPVDRWVVGLNSDLFNALSFATEYAAGILAAVTPWLALRRPHSRFIQLAFLLEATLWNGVWMETCRNFVQRPRPFVYEAPLAYGKVVAHYTSFYSGHTSFAAVGAMTSWLLARHWGASRPRLRMIGILGVALTFLTGLFRVLSARHFVTDVLMGALAGSLAALWVMRASLRAPHR